MPWPVKEAVAAAISQSNACPYCVEIHAAIASVGMNQPLAPRLMQGRTAELTGPSLRPILTWAASTRSPGSAPLFHPPFTAFKPGRRLRARATPERSTVPENAQRG